VYKIGWITIRLLSTGRRVIRQGSILAPFCFAICINDTIKLCMKCHLGDILVYADDILSIARSVTGLQRMILVVETYLNWLDLSINCAKSCCMRIGKRSNCSCADIVSIEQVQLYTYT
jgi:Reverse transcriptase (RNA-dependent DNA polymerase)